MKTQTISYLHNDQLQTANVQLISPLAWIFVVSLDETGPFHLEYDEEQSKWAVIDEDLQIEDAIIMAIGKVLFKNYGKTIKPSANNISDYFILDNGTGDLICFWSLELRIRVTPLIGNHDFETSEELVYYGNDFGKPLVFQTIDYRGEDPTRILAAIKWYAQQLNYPEMAISKKNPLPDTDTAILFD